jgi:hypothetical protein
LEEKIEQAKQAAIATGFSLEQVEQAPKVKELHN